MARHHIVQDKYLTQWRKADTENQLNIYVIPENKIIERGPGWKGFWRDDFNVLVDDGTKSYLPEDVTAIIDTKGIETIKKIDPSKETQLSGEDRSAIAFYIALQYIRTPRHREETDKMVGAQIQHFMKMDVSSPDKVNLSKEEILKHVPKNKREEEALEKISGMSDEEIKQQIYESIHSDQLRAGLTATGHSKSILKVDRHSKEIFEFQWLLMKAPVGSSFVTSDNPCFTIAPTKIMNGLLSPRATIIFPIRPDLCLYIKPALKSKVEHYLELDMQQLDDFNHLILTHSYECVVAKEKTQLEVLTKDYDYTNHKKSREIVISESGPYVMFNAE